MQVDAKQHAGPGDRTRLPVKRKVSGNAVRSPWLASLLLIAVLAPTALWASPGPQVPAVRARAALVMDADRGEVLWGRAIDERMPPASTTKILTAVVGLESGRLDERFTVSRYAALQPPSKIGLLPGQEARLRDLVYALMLNSANDAAVVVAEGLSGSVAEFSDRMNAKARSIGAMRSDFQNPNGLPDPDHLTTARDLAHIMRYALDVPGFRAVASTRTAEMTVSGTSTRRIDLRTHNRLLSNYIVPVIGKTGYTRAAGRCFVGAAELDGRSVIVVVLNSSDPWGDSRRLIEFGLGVDPQRAAQLQLASTSGRDEGDQGEEVYVKPSRRGRTASRAIGSANTRSRTGSASLSRASTSRSSARSGDRGRVTKQRGESVRVRRETCVGNRCRSETALVTKPAVSSRASKTATTPAKTATRQDGRKAAVKEAASRSPR